MGGVATSTLAARADELASSCSLSGWDGDPERCRWCGTWLGKGGGQGGPFCCGLCSKVFWANHSWKAAKEECKKRAGRKCERCQTPARATHQVHHRKGPQEGGRTRAASCEHHQAGLVYLCQGCHHGEHHSGPR